MSIIKRTSNRTSIADYIEKIRETPHNPARADPERIWVLTMALFCRNTLCISRKSDEVRAQIIWEAPKSDCAMFPRERKQLRSGGVDLLALREQLKKKKGYEG